MSILKKIVEFIRIKLGTFVTKNVTVEDQMTQAAEQIIAEVHKLKTRHVTAKREITEKEAQAVQKDAAAESKEKEIRRLLAENPNANVDTHAKLGLLYRRTAQALRSKATDLTNMLVEIENTVVALDDQREDLKVKLEYIRETRNANSMGLDNVADIVESASLMKVDVETAMSRIDTFNTTPVGIETTTADLQEYLASLKG